MPSDTGSIKAWVIHNPTAGSAERLAELEGLIAADARLVLKATGAPGDASRLAQQAARERVGCVVAAGGDGTVSEVVNGLMSAGGEAEALPRLLIIPMGTGNDLPRTLELPESLAELVDLIDGGRPRALDVLRWELSPADGAQRRGGWCVNVIAGGFAAKLKEALTPEVKKFWGPLAYARAAVGSLGEIENPHALSFSIDGGPPQATSAINVIVANARYAGGGIEVAPSADPSDGLLDLVVITPGGLLDLAEVTAKLLQGEVDESQHTLRCSGRALTLSAEPAMPFNIDGDLAGEGSLSIEVVPGALQVMVPAEAPGAARQESESGSRRADR